MVGIGSFMLFKGLRGLTRGQMSRSRGGASFDYSHRRRIGRDCRKCQRRKKANQQCTFHSEGEGPDPRPFNGAEICSRLIYDMVVRVGKSERKRTSGSTVGNGTETRRGTRISIQGGWLTLPRGQLLLTRTSTGMGTGAITS